MLREVLGQAFFALTLFGCLILVLATLALIFLLSRHLALRARGVAEEAWRLAGPLPPDAALPHVVVQIPSYNEGAIVARGIASAALLDWPKDKLHIQVCDDSTDDTTALAQAAVQRCVATGIDAVVLHRTDRWEFKAGALQSAIAQTPHDYFAILDVDYVPHPDFLRRCMTALIADPKLAFVQARPDFLNSGENLMTRAQTFMLDYHYGIEQATRSWGGMMLPFNGTCGIWRRAAIDAGGGWSGDTLNEDWDLSYRAWNAGWRGTFLATVPVPGELPTGLGAWMTQQRRWASGIGQVALKLLPRVLRNPDLSFSERWGGLFPLFAWFGHVMFAVTMILAVIALLLKPSLGWRFALFVYAVYLFGWAALFGSMLIANRFVGRNTPLWRYVIDFQIVPYLTLYVCWANLRSLPATLMGRSRVFVRTPKRGSASTSS